MTKPSSIRIRIISRRLAEAVKWLERRPEQLPTLLADTEWLRTRDIGRVGIITQLSKSARSARGSRRIEIDRELASSLVAWLDPSPIWEFRPAAIRFLQTQLRRELARSPGHKAHKSYGGQSPRQRQRQRGWKRQQEADRIQHEAWIKSLPRRMIDHPVFGRIETTSIF